MLMGDVKLLDQNEGQRIIHGSSSSQSVMMAYTAAHSPSSHRVIQKHPDGTYALSELHYRSGNLSLGNPSRL